jgi:RNA-binding protein YlmH
MADLIKSADVKVNWRLATKSAVEIGPGDVITCAGKGRLEVKTVNATKKGKWSVEMVRYL